jgi:hypothetical protein
MQSYAMLVSVCTCWCSGELWRTMRLAWQPAFQSGSLEGYTDLMDDCAAQLAEVGWAEVARSVARRWHVSAEGLHAYTCMLTRVRPTRISTQCTGMDSQGVCGGGGEHLLDTGAWAALLCHCQTLMACRIFAYTKSIAMNSWRNHTCAELPCAVVCCAVVCSTCARRARVGRWWRYGGHLAR